MSQLQQEPYGGYAGEIPRIFSIFLLTKKNIMVK